MPKDIVKSTPIVAKRYNISSLGQVAIIVSTINTGNGNLSKFSLSETTSRRHNKIILTDEGGKTKKTFISKAKHLSLTLHLDTKKITDVLNQGKNVERLAVILCSPDLNNPQLIGVFRISDGCGITQATAIKKVLNNEIFSKHLIV